MPEIPDLECYARYLGERLPGRAITQVDISIPYVIRYPKDDFIAALRGDRFASVHRHGKFLLFGFESGRVMVVQAMLTGRYQWAAIGGKKKGRTIIVLDLDDGNSLRYHDLRVMGRIYLSDPEHILEVPHMAKLGPDIMARDFTEDEFIARTKRYRGQIKSILINEEFVAGIGNAYSDEILWWAQIHPYRKRTELTDDDLGRLYRSAREVFEWATPIVWDSVKDNLDTKPRDFLNVHRKGGDPCPRCGATISEITAGQRITSFCRTCQPETPGGKG